MANSHQQQLPYMVKLNVEPASRERLACLKEEGKRLGSSIFPVFFFSTYHQKATEQSRAEDLLHLVNSPRLSGRDPSTTTSSSLMYIPHSDVFDDFWSAHFHLFNYIEIIALFTCTCEKIKPPSLLPKLK